MVGKEKESRFRQNILIRSDWLAITKEFDRLPKPGRDPEGEVLEGWVFRGHTSKSYRLQPSIEREYPLEWPEVEDRALREFQSKARMHMGAASLPNSDDKLGWLAIMQHYGAPTRLLDFTYSPYIALYFALRNHRANERVSHAEVWGIDAAALRRRAAETSRAADNALRDRQASTECRKCAAAEKPKAAARASDWRVNLSRHLEKQVSPLQKAQKDVDFWDRLVSNALSPCGVRREHFNQNGFVSIALPPVHNPRLSSQQGVFLFNGAESLGFEESLDDMMSGVTQQWYKRFQVPKSALDEIEKRLFQINIHELSLFPDITGLAGFVRQKLRLQ
jgi:hypothetical protein